VSNIYKTIEGLRKLQGIGKMEFYRLVEMTSVGYATMVKNDTMKLSTLKKIAEVLKTSLADILDEEMRDESQVDFKTSPAIDEEITAEILDDSISDAEKIIILKDRITSLSSQLKMSIHIAEIRRRKIESLERKSAD
jgi:DNA-binding Xre family transcriptional regulator